MSLNAYLGRSETASNFECELMRLSLGMEVGAALVRSSNIQSIALLSDSQAAIKRLQNPMAPKPGQYLVHQIFEQLRALPTDISILVKWCLGHAGVPGNELADCKAGQAAEEKNDNQTTDVQRINSKIYGKNWITREEDRHPHGIPPFVGHPPTPIKPRPPQPIPIQVQDVLIPHLRQMQSPGISKSLPPDLQTLPRTTPDSPQPTQGPKTQGQRPDRALPAKKPQGSNPLSKLHQELKTLCELP
ncbi:hypothetical protein Pst134EA_030232 [Puccinia striiformis f. sp. tritici]|uniref:hypothetical protein n=1 Tax=Puccinia striiformis f. sp. tritici TaxID=168172 RepID=UPI002008CA9D|nr:hypothetical protein Pst134EA_030232 [Puccinia striiformis f. sp. tritici]KAH9446311.1 hypothetical protein Pst134EA_030232 [Puccinia striiformis f. sp. tritici]